MTVARAVARPGRTDETLRNTGPLPGAWHLQTSLYLLGIEQTLFVFMRCPLPRSFLRGRSTESGSLSHDALCSRPLFKTAVTKRMERVLKKIKIIIIKKRSNFAQGMTALRVLLQSARRETRLSARNRPITAGLSSGDLPPPANERLGVTFRAFRRVCRLRGRFTPPSLPRRRRLVIIAVVTCRLVFGK